MANYKVGDLDVTISGVSKDAVSSLDEVIKKLDALQGKLESVSKGFSGAFNVNVNNAAIRATTQGFAEIEETVQSATDNIERFNGTIQNGSPESANRIEEITESAENLVKTFSKFDEARAQVSKLSSELLNIHFETGDFDESKVSEMLALTKQLDETNEAFKRLSMTEQELFVYEFQQENATRKQRIAYLQLMLATGQAAEKTAEYKRELRQLNKEQENADKVAGKLHKGSFSKLIGKISRIALYRTIRRGLQMITQTFTESIQSYAQVDENINKMMTQLTSSTKVISLSLGTIIFPMLQAITPVVQSLSYGFGNMANAINKSMALAQGNATYTKINTEALKDYAKQLNKTSGALFDFDKFRALNSKQDDNSIFLSTEDVSALDEAESKYSGIYTLVSGIGSLLSQALRLVGQIVEAATPIIDIVFKIAGWLLKGVGYVLEFLNNTGLIEPILYGILTVLGLIGAAKVITWISSGAAKTAILNLATAIKTNLSSALTKAVELAGTAKGAFLSWGLAIAAVTAAVKILSNWDEFNRGTKIAITVISTLATVLGIAFITVLALRHAFEGVAGVMTALGLGVATLASAVVAVRGLVDIPQYAVGASDIDSGSLFIAGEAGKTEMVYTGDNGKANVANVQQMYQADLTALNEWWKTARNDIAQIVPQLQTASDTGIYQAASRGARKSGKAFNNV